MHWADVVAKRLASLPDAYEKVHTIATGITPSGHIHVGNMREILTGDMVQRSARDIGLKVKLIYIGDTIDPLRKVYPFLDDSYQEHVGKPLCDIPCPCGEHSSYAEHFLEPFLEALGDLGVEHETVLTHEMYRQGRYTPGIRKVLSSTDGIRDIITSISKRDLPRDWMPFAPICADCGSITKTRPLSYSDPMVHYHCDNCGYEGEADIRKGEGKLPWRVDWPTRWDFLGVACEPFGKDHAAAGGSYETGSEILRQVFHREPPEPVIYEWIQLKGKGAMASSTGVVVTAAQMLKMTPPEVLRFLIARNRPQKHIDFDPGLGILNLVDDLDRYERVYYKQEEGFSTPEERRTYVLSLADLGMVKALRGKMSFDDKGEMLLDTSDMPHPVKVPYRHMVTLSQLTDDPGELSRIVKRAEGIDIDAMDPHSREIFDRRLECVTYWLHNSAPPALVFRIRDELTQEHRKSIGQDEGQLLAELARTLEDVEWNADDIHQGFYELAERTGMKPGQIFKVAYKAILNMERGPRLGYFLSTLDREFVLKRFRLDG